MCALRGIGCQILGGSAIDELGRVGAVVESPCAVAVPVCGLAAGTLWLWARDDMAGAVDVLFVDEAGQMSLANVLAVSQAADSLVLLGDLQQLDQPQQGTHPRGTAASALKHLVGGATLEADRGLFLEETWRLHPEVCAFTSELYYEGKLTSVAQTHGQRVDGPEPFNGVGLRFVPVAHSGNSSESAEEVQVVREFVDALLAARPSRTRRGGWSSCSTRIG